MTDAQKKALLYVAKFDGVLALDLGAHLDHTLTGRARSAKGAGVLRELIRRGYVERKLQRRELYGYFITSAGRRAAKEIA